MKRMFAFRATHRFPTCYPAAPLTSRRKLQSPRLKVDSEYGMRREGIEPTASRSEPFSSAPRSAPAGAQRGPGVELSPQLTAFFTSAPILASSAAVNSIRAKEVGHMAPSSRCASSLKPNVAYLVLNFCAGWKKQTTLPSLA